MEEQLLEFFKTFADLSRLRLAGIIADQPLTVDEIAARLRIKASEVPRHLAQIEKLGLLTAAKGRYQLDSKAFEQLRRSLLSGQKPAAEPHSDDDQASREEQAIVRNFTTPDGRIREIPSQAKKRVALLRHVVQAFEPGMRYTEKQVNETLMRYYTDFASLRRYLIDDRLLERSTNGAEYWRPEEKE